MTTRERTLKTRQVLREVLKDLVVTNVTRVYSEPRAKGRMRVKLWMLRGGWMIHQNPAELAKLDTELQGALGKAGVVFDRAGWNFCSIGWQGMGVLSYQVYI